MKYTLFNSAQPNTLQLQGIGHVLGTPASEIKEGDSLMWNYGELETVTGFDKETAAYINVIIDYTNNGKTKEYKRKLKKNRLVCILK